jgi:hypothetical protein
MDDVLRRLHQLPGSGVRRRHDGDADLGPVPRLLLTDLTDRQTQSMTDPVDDRPETGTLLLERTGAVHPQFDADRDGVHVTPGSGPGNLAELVGLDDVAALEVLEVRKADTALEA